MSSTGFYGIYRNRTGWAARVYVRGVARYIGTYRTPAEAARAYDVAAKQLLGDKARLNYPDEER